MHTRLRHRFPNAAVRSAFLMLVIGLAGAGRTAADPANVPEAPAELVWVRQDDPVINVNNDPTFGKAPEGDRFEGSFWEYIVDETAIIYEERFVDHGYEYYHITLRSDFDRPPLVINPPLRYKVTGRAAHSATKTEGVEGVGFQFWYNSDYASVEPSEVLAYYPWSPNFTGQDSKEWMVSAPEPRQAGDTFKLYAGWWNCPPCNVTWTYKAEPADAVERLGVQVVEPVVMYQGEEVPPGEIFFPETCPLPGGRLASDCTFTQHYRGSGSAYHMCMTENMTQIIAILDRSRLSDYAQELVFYVAAHQSAEECRYAQRDGDDNRLDIVLEQGGMFVQQVVHGQTFRVTTDPGTATADRPGAFAAGYDPERQTAVFRAISSPLTIEAQAGGTLVLQPAQQVELTTAGFGPVTELPRVYLPMQTR